MELENGKVYRVKHSSGEIKARLIDHGLSHNWLYRKRVWRAHVINLATNRECEIKSPGKFLGLAE